MKQVVISLINIYQKYVSPYKGYRCAHAAMYGGVSCSEAIKRLVVENGVFASTPLIRPRFQACREAYGLYATQRKDDEQGSNKKSERCDVPGCLSGISVCGTPTSSAGASCDLPCGCGW